MLLFFFFKQKTAYEMRISDWSSDVCSSDLGRWATGRGLPRVFGHRRGAEVTRKILRRADELGVSYLTFYSFSSENWRRPPREVEDLMGLLRLYTRSEVADLHRSGVRVRMSGDRTRMPRDIVALVVHAEPLTVAHQGIQMVLARSDGSRAEQKREEG